MRITFDTNNKNEVEMVKTLLGMQTIPHSSNLRPSVRVAHPGNALHKIKDPTNHNEDDGHLRSADVKILEGLASGITRSRDLREYSGLTTLEWQVAIRRLKKSGAVTLKGLKNGAVYKLKN